MNQPVKQLSNIIDGSLVEPDAAASLDVINPADRSVLATLPLSGEGDVDRAVRSAKGALDGWGALTPSERSRSLSRIADALESRLDEFGRLEALDAGKPDKNAKEDELPLIIDCLRFFAGATRTLEGRNSAEYVAGHTSIIRREPIGVMAAITPWNYPLWQAVWKVAPALATGNTVVIKPAELTPMTTALFVELAQEFLPPGVLNLVLGDGPGTGQPLAAHEDIGMVSFTGSSATGRRIAEVASAKVKRLVLELGGNAPVVVFDDVEVESVLETLTLAGYYNAGQECTAGSRVLVAADRYDDVVGGLAREAGRYKVGDTLDPDTRLGPLISEKQRQRVLELLEGRSSGTEVVAGGTVPELPGFFVDATVIAGVEQDDALVQSEIFGPAITVQPFRDEDEAIARANDTRYGLAASVWTRDGARALRVGNALKFGTVWINDHFVLTPDMPHGGFKESGYGKEGSIYALEECTNIKHLVVNIEK